MPGKRRLISNFSRSYFLLVNIIRLVLDIFFTDICFSIPVRNKFCFTGGIFEASVQLPGANNVVGMWPAIWTMGISAELAMGPLWKEWYVFPTTYPLLP